MDSIIHEAFELSATAVDHEDLTQRIIADLKKYLLTSPDKWPEFSITAVPSPHATSDLTELYALLAQAANLYDQLWVENELIPSRWKLVTRIKKNLHQLAVFYVNLLGEKQIEFNDRILRTANELASIQSARDKETAVLQKQIASLQRRLDALEKQQR